MVVRLVSLKLLWDAVKLEGATHQNILQFSSPTPKSKQTLTSYHKATEVVASGRNSCLGDQLFSDILY